MSLRTLDAAIPAGASVLIDTSVALAYLSGTESARAMATQLFDDHLANGRESGALSMVTVGEILVRPFRAGSAAVAVAEGFLQHFADLRLIDVDYAIAREAARIRAGTELRMPDALILSTALAISADQVVTNDRRLASAAERIGLGTCFLGSLRPT